MRQLTAGWLVAAFLLAAIVPLADRQHALFDDLLCADPVQAGSQTSRLRTAPDNTPDDHCAVCHLQRAVRHASVASSVSVSIVEIGTAGRTRLTLRPSATVVQHASSRAPPAV